MMHLCKEEIVDKDAKKVCIGDLTQEGLNISANHSVWPGSEFLRYNSLSKGVFKMMLLSLKSCDADELAANVVFVNARRASHRVGIEAAKIINALVDQEILNHRPWVRETDGQPASKNQGPTSRCSARTRYLLFGLH